MGTPPATRNLRDKKNIIEHFTRIGDIYQQKAYGKRTFANQPRQQRRELVLSLLAGRPRLGIVLDAGSGPDVIYPELLPRCEAYWALDMVPANLDRITRNYGDRNVVTVQGDLDDYSPGELRFDTILASGSLEYLSFPAKALRTLVASLAPGGRLLASFPNTYSPYRLWSEYAYNDVRRLSHTLSGRATYRYRRRLFRGYRLKSMLLDENPLLSVEVVYFAARLLLQPWDKVLPAIDLAIVGALERHLPKALPLLATEFVLVVDRPPERNA